MATTETISADSEARASSARPHLSPRRRAIDGLHILTGRKGPPSGPPDWWFILDPSPRFLVDGDGALISANPAGEAVLHEGQLTTTCTGALRFGSVECDNRFLAAVHEAVGQNARSRAVLRQRNGGWFAADIHGVPGEPLAVVGLKDELAPTHQAMAAIRAAFQLTASELDVLHHLLNGKCPKTAAIDLHISEHTVRAHLRSLYAKMNARGLISTIRLSCTFI
jgi:DNA-binding CsgD family transcriptional regulator